MKKGMSDGATLFVLILVTAAATGIGCITASDYGWLKGLGAFFLAWPVFFVLAAQVFGGSD